MVNCRRASICCQQPPETWQPKATSFVERPLRQTHHNLPTTTPHGDIAVGRHRPQDDNPAHLLLCRCQDSHSPDPAHGHRQITGRHSKTGKAMTRLLRHTRTRSRLWRRRLDKRLNAGRRCLICWAGINAVSDELLAMRFYGAGVVFILKFAIDPCGWWLHYW
jgi:hypothetical protein